MDLFIATSTVDDGSMKSPDEDQAAVRATRAKFLEKQGLNPADSTLFTLTYDRDDYCEYIELPLEQKGDGITREATVLADAVVVTRPNHAVMLPLADCVGAVIHDPTKKILMVAHLGRHSLEQYGGAKCVRYLVDNYGSNTNNLTAWLSPAAGRDSYPLEAFDGHGLQEVATEQLMNAGILPMNIRSDHIDTTVDPNYFSHSEFLKGNRETDGRFCIVAMMEN